MKKKRLLIWLAAASMLVCGFAFASCKTPVQGEDGRGIVKVEIIDGCLWITYTDSETPVNIGKVVADTAQEETGTDGLAYYPLPDGTYAVAQGNTMYLEEIVIPSTYKDKAVTLIADNAFQDANLTSVTIPDSVTSIGSSAFYDCYRLTSVYYKGTSEEWGKISIWSYNDKLKNATLYYYSETEPTESGNYWHYVNGVPTKWE